MSGVPTDRERLAAAILEWDAEMDRRDLFPEVVFSAKLESPNGPVDKTAARSLADHLLAAGLTFGALPTQRPRHVPCVEKGEHPVPLHEPVPNEDAAVGVAEGYRDEVEAWKRNLGALSPETFSMTRWDLRQLIRRVAPFLGALPEKPGVTEGIPVAEYERLRNELRLANEAFLKAAALAALPETQKEGFPHETRAGMRCHCGQYHNGKVVAVDASAAAPLPLQREAPGLS